MSFVQAREMTRNLPLSKLRVPRLLRPALLGAVCCTVLGGGFGALPGRAQGTPVPTQQAVVAAQVAPASAPAPKAKLTVSKADAERAEKAYLAGARLVDKKDFAGAQKQFDLAATLNPDKPEYARALLLARQQRVAELVQRAAQARMRNNDALADTLLAQARAIDPENEFVLQHAAADVSAAALTEGQSDQTRARLARPERSFAGPIQIAATPDVKDLHLRGEPRQVVTEALRAFGVKAVFDENIAGQSLRFDLEQTTYAEAIPILLRMNHLFAVPLDDKTLLISKDSQENRDRLERLVEESVYIPGSTNEQLNEYLSVVKNVFDVQKIYLAPTSGTMIIRAPEATIKAINYTLADLVDGGAQVVLRVQLVSLDRTKTRNIGASPPSSVGAFSIAAEAQSIVSQNQSLVQTLITSGGYVPTGNYAMDILNEAGLLILSGAVTDAKLTGLLGTVGGGLTLLGINYGGSVAFNLALNESEARALDDISVRIGNGQQTTLRIGEKYPITTATYSSAGSSSLASLLAGKTINGVSASSLLAQYSSASSVATVPQVQFEDLGITLKTGATVLKSGLVAVQVDMKIEALTGASNNNIPILTSRVFTSTITLQDGSTAIMISDLSKTEAASVNGIPGISELPGFQQSVADELREVDGSELVLLITPHIVRSRSGQMASRRIAFTTSVPQDN